MSIGAQTALALLRALLIALFAVGLSGGLSRWLAAQRGRARLAAWLLLLAPYFTPALIVSYAYSKVALLLLVWPFWHDALYVAVLALKLTPLAVVIRTLLPSPLGAEGRHTFDLLASGRKRVGDIENGGASQNMVERDLRARFPTSAGGGSLLERWGLRPGVLQNAPGGRVPPFCARPIILLHALASTSRRIVFHFRGAGAGPWIAGALVFLFAFADFELASLWSIRTWTMAVFDAQIGGLALPETLRLAIWPLTVQLVVLAMVITRSGNRTAPSTESPVSRSRWPWGYLVLTATSVSLAPLGLILIQSTTGWATLATNFVLTREIGASVIFALVAACCAEGFVQWLAHAGTRKITHAKAQRRKEKADPSGTHIQPERSSTTPDTPSTNAPQHHSSGHERSAVAEPTTTVNQHPSPFAPLRLGVLFKTGLHRPSFLRAAPLVLVLPGLLGALIVSLLLLALFQLPLLHAGYDTPLPLALALTIILLPTALLIHALFPPTSPALHLARQNGSGRLLWPMSIRPRFIGWSVLFCAAYFDFTAASILAPIGFTPVFVRLHNLAHYGQTAVLSAMLIAAFVVPLLIIGIAGATLRTIATFRR